MKRCFFVVRFSFVAVAWLFLLLLSSCASKQKTNLRSAHLESRETEQTELFVNKQVEAAGYWYRDSSQLVEQFLIYPEGAVEINANGFVGNAKAVLWLRQQRAQRELASNQSFIEETIQHEEGRERATLSETEVASSVKTTGFASLRWGIGISLLLLVLVYWYWRKR